MGGIKHFPLARVKTSNVHQNGACYTVLTLHIFHLEITCKYICPCYTFHWNKPNFITVPYLSGSWLNIIDVRGDVNIFQKRLIVSALYPESSSSLFTFLACSCSDMLVISTSALLYS